MRKKLSILFLSVLAACLVFGACGGGDNTSSSAPTSSQGPTWEDEVIEDQEYSEIELPEVERP